MAGRRIADQRWTRIGADARRAADATGTPASARNCREWSATLGRSSERSSRIHVMGTCQYPTTGYTAELRAAEPQNIVPQTLELELVVHAPTGIQAQQVALLRWSASPGWSRLGR